MVDLEKRRIIRNGLIWLVGSLVFPDYALATESKRDRLYRDSDNILLARMIFGEGRDKKISTSEKITIGFTPINRVKNRKNKMTLKEVLLKKGWYSCFNDNPKNKKGYQNFLKVLNPFSYEPYEWIEDIKIADKLLNGIYDESNFGPTHYHRKDIEEPDWVPEMKRRLDSTGFVHQFYIGV